MIYQLINKPWEWRRTLADRRAAQALRRQRNEEWVQFWRDMSHTTCRACLREKPHAHFHHSRICGACWSLLLIPVDKLTVRQSIRVNRMDEFFIARGIGSIRTPAWQ